MDPLAWASDCAGAHRGPERPGPHRRGNRHDHPTPPDDRARCRRDHLAATNRVRGSGLLEADGGGPVLAGQTGTFEVTARRSDRLSILTMFVQSNDFFYGDDGEGIALFERGRPISGDVTGDLLLWNAGTERDTARGTGPYQVLVQPSPDSGPGEGEVVMLSSQTDDDFDLPAVADVIRVTVEPIS